MTWPRPPALPLYCQDIALYASLCALASFDREELGRRLVSNIGFKELLGTVPEVGGLGLQVWAPPSRLQRDVAHACPTV